MTKTTPKERTQESLESLEYVIKEGDEKILWIATPAAEISRERVKKAIWNPGTIIMLFPIVLCLIITIFFSLQVSLEAGLFTIIFPVCWAAMLARPMIDMIDGSINLIYGRAFAVTNKAVYIQCHAYYTRIPYEDIENTGCCQEDKFQKKRNIGTVIIRAHMNGDDLHEKMDDIEKYSEICELIDAQLEERGLRKPFFVYKPE